MAKDLRRDHRAVQLGAPPQGRLGLNKGLLRPDPQLLFTAHSLSPGFGGGPSPPCPSPIWDHFRGRKWNELLLGTS